MKKFMLILVLMIAGLYILGFGIYTVSITHMFLNGLALICLGTLTFCFSVVLTSEFFSERRNRKIRNI
jgi:hypothetical protein